MRSVRAVVHVAVVAAMVASAVIVEAQDRKAVPREGTQTSGGRPNERRPPPEEAKPPQRTPPDNGNRRAQARPAPRNGTAGRAGDARARREPPRRAVVPQRYLAVPRPYYFPLIDARLSFYYHPYFGFYYGPYYGPYYPYPGPLVRPIRYSSSAIRLKVKPVEAEVYVNGYYAGIVDDFDGVFQRLYLPAGEHQVTLRLAGYETLTLPVRAPAGDTLDITHQMRRLAEGERASPLPAPRALPPEWTEPSADPDGEQPASPYGILALRTEPPDARIVVDGEAWAAVGGQAEFVIHLPAGWHQVEVRRDGYQTFSIRAELMEGRTTRLDARLVRQ